MDYIKAAATSDPRLAQLPLSQRAAAMRTNSATQMMSKAALNQWQGRVLQLLKANQTAGGSGMLGPNGVTDQEYVDNLEDFVEKVMLQKPIESLDSNSGTRLNQMINSVMTVKNDPKKMQTAFQDLAAITTAARMDPSKTGAAPGAAQGSQQTGAKPAVQNTVQGVKVALQGINTQTVAQNLVAANNGQPVAASKTNNDLVNRVLTTLGVQLT